MPGGEYPLQPRVAVGTVVFKDGDVLLVKRKHPPNQGIWAVPGGSVELGESLSAAAEREVLEETGVVVCAGAPVYSFDAVVHDAAGRVRYHYVIIDLLARYVSGEPIAADDALDARWVTASELSGLEVSATTLDLLRNTLAFGSDARPGTP